MSKDWVHVIGSIVFVEDNMLPRIDFHGENTFLPLSRALRIQRFDGDDADLNYFLHNNCGEKTNPGTADKLKAMIFGRYITTSKATDIQEYFPLYFMVTDSILGVYPQQVDTKTYKGTLLCLIHPSERERMERYLTGTSNPIHDLVHELRYNPAVGVAPEKQEATKNRDLKE